MNKKTSQNYHLTEKIIYTAKVHYSLMFSLPKQNGHSSLTANIQKCTALDKEVYRSSIRDDFNEIYINRKTVGTHTNHDFP